jgi:hypothetical protein
MDKLGIKTTIYDLLGYIIPGLLSLIFLYMFMYNKDIKWIFSLKLVEYSAPFYILMFILSYVAGQTISSASSFLFEGNFTKKLFGKWTLQDYSEHNLRTNELFKKDYKDCDKQILNSYCQQKFPKVYDTAFVFLTLYGLSRNISASLVIFDIYLIKTYGIISTESFVMIISTVFLIRNYYRFKKYFDLKINSALYL